MQRHTLFALALLATLCTFVAPSSAHGMRDPIGYADGMSLYAGYHVMHGGLDPTGLSPKLGAFSGINSYEKPSSEDSYRDTYTGNYLIDLVGNLKGSSHYVTPQLSNNSILGTRTGYDGDRNVFWNSRVKLDREAQYITQAYYMRGELRGDDPTCPSRIKVLMIQPKIRKLPSISSGGCEVQKVVAYAIWDPVPNQELFAPDTSAYWNRWGSVDVIDPPGSLGRNHSVDDVLHGNSTLLQNTGDRERRWADSGSYQPINQWITPWMSDDANDYVFVCHSQGCNILMHVLEHACAE